VLNADAAQRVSPYHRFSSRSCTFEKVVEKHRTLKQPCSLLPEHRPLAGYGPHRQALLASRELATLLRAVLALSQRRGAKTLAALGAALRLARVALRAVPADDAGELHQLASLLAAAAANDVTREFAPTIDAALDAMPASVTAAFRRQPVEDTDAADKASRAKEKRRRMKDKIMERMKKQQAAFVADGDNDGAPGDASAAAADTDAPADISAPTAAATAATPKSSAAPLHGAGTAADVNALAQGDAELEAPEDANSCILCRSSSESASPLGTLSLVQRSAVAKHHTHSLWRDAATAPLNGAPTLHAQGALAFELVVTSCGHVVHEACRTGYLESLLASIRSHRAFAGRGLVEPERGEMLCPLCKTKSNLFVPSGAAVSVPAPVPDLRADATDDRDPERRRVRVKGVRVAHRRRAAIARATAGDAEPCDARLPRDDGRAAPRWSCVCWPTLARTRCSCRWRADTCDAVELASRTAPLRGADVGALPLGEARLAGARRHLLWRRRARAAGDAQAYRECAESEPERRVERAARVAARACGSLSRRAAGARASRRRTPARLGGAHTAARAHCTRRRVRRVGARSARAAGRRTTTPTALPPAFVELVEFVGRELAGGHIARACRGVCVLLAAAASARRRRRRGGDRHWRHHRGGATADDANYHHCFIVSACRRWSASRRGVCATRRRCATCCISGTTPARRR
jgi:hypothetical protein